MKRLSLSLLTVAMLLITSAAQASPPSGMLLGIYARPSWRGIRVVGTICGYSAEGRIFPGDLLLRVTDDGMRFFETRALLDFEKAKDLIGPFRPAAVELFRPGYGKVYLWVEFQPVGDTAACHESGGGQVRAKIMTERERPGARALFEGGASPQGPHDGHQHGPQTGTPGGPQRGYQRGPQTATPSQQPQGNNGNGNLAPPAPSDLNRSDAPTGTMQIVPPNSYSARDRRFTDAASLFDMR